MEGTYAVMLGPLKMGAVAVKKCGLYWQFDCSCNLCGDVMYDLAVRIGDSEVKLGLLTPKDGSFCIFTKLPAKRLGQGSPEFYLRPRHALMKDILLPVKPDEPFQYLHRLEDAFLARKNGQIGVVFHEEK